MVRLPMLALAACAACAISGAPAFAQHAHPSPYAGQDRQEITSLSAADIEELRRGGGWGLAKPAEFNGAPGPAHLLEMKEEIRLRPDQVEQITSIFKRMQGEAIAAGEELIELERKLDVMFRERKAERESLLALLRQIGEVRARLRFVHLVTHLETPAILTREQIETYNRLRGYGQASCGAVPAGHDPVMWRKHHGCD